MDQLLPHDFLDSSYVNVIHTLNTGDMISGYQFFGDTFKCLYLPRDPLDIIITASEIFDIYNHASFGLKLSLYRSKG